MARRPDAPLEVALGQRQRVLEEAQQVFSKHERALQEQARLLTAAQARVQMILLQIDAAHVEQHCRQCRICEVALEEAQKRFRALQAVPASEASEELIRTTLAAIESACVGKCSVIFSCDFSFGPLAGGMGTLC